LQQATLAYRKDAKSFIEKTSKELGVFAVRVIGCSSVSLDMLIRLVNMTGTD
jgi:hypothetical protein